MPPTDPITRLAACKPMPRRFLRALALAGAVAAAPLQAQDAAPSDQPVPLAELQLLSDVFGHIKSQYVEPVDDTVLLRAAINGMLNSLDPHSAFLEPDAFSDIRVSTEGRFGGLGIEVTTDNGLIRIVAPIDDTPAFEAGLQPGDLIIRLDDEPVGQDLRQAVNRMRGEPGSTIKLTILRQGRSEPFDVVLTRAIIRVTSVRGEMLDAEFGYIRLSGFQNQTAERLADKIAQLQTANDGILNGLILDLRNNPGGILRSAVQVSDLFLHAGVIVSTRGRNTPADNSYAAEPGDVLGDKPIVVLVNAGSASASEIVAGALQDHRRALIAGTKTFGKGSVQTVIPMRNGAALKITTARYYTPANRSIQATGIVPDIVIEQLEVEDPDDQPGDLRESGLSGHLVGENEPAPGAAAPPPVELSGLLAADYQLRQALNLLKGVSLIQSAAPAPTGG